MAEGKAGPVLDWLINGIGLGRSAGLLDRNRTRVDKAAHADDLVALRRSASVYGEAATFEENLRAALSRHRSAGEGDGVTLSTVHRVKGMEWDRVVVFGADRGLMPHGLAENVEEERRVLYVAITRGRRQTVVVADSEQPSRFLAEMRGRTPPEKRGPTEKRGSASPPRAKTGQAGTPIGFDPALFEKLKAWRLEAARELEVPAYIVFSNRTLEEMAARRPQTERDLLGVSGVGPTKLELYGEAVLEILAEDPAS